jgi:glycosyltransferase involved in cell wall biosynthesis
MRKLSIIIPAYNEEQFIGTLLRRIQEVSTELYGFEKEIVVVDDGSSDRTYEIAAQFRGVRCIRQSPNRGKGRAVQRGFLESTGDFVLVQDADLEYDPNDYLPMLRALGENERIAVYGSRVLGQLKHKRGISSYLGKHKDQTVGAWLANVLLSLWTFLLYGKWIADPLTAYKLYPSEILKSFVVKTHGFETDHEITAKLIRSGVPIIEVPISYSPRSVEEGKKIKARDGFIAVWTLVRFRFVN